MDRLANEFFHKLNRGPVFLFLGQEYLKLESGKDPFLTEILRKYVPDKKNASSYNQILKIKDEISTETALAWMQNRCDRLPIPEWIKQIATFSWSGVYTSAIDTLWLRSFRKEWREFQPLFEEKYYPTDPRNRNKLHCTFLFGAVDRVEEAERPPLNKLEFIKRKQVAVSLFRRLPEYLTPFGVLVIEGYNIDSDWFNPDDLVPVVDELPPGSTHIFSASENIKENPLINDFVNNKKIILHSENLSTFLNSGFEAGFLKVSEPLGVEDFSKTLQIGDALAIIPSQLWIQVSRSAMIPDDTILSPPPKLSKDRKYQEFRNFLAESGIKPIWSGYARGFSFRRTFENQLEILLKKRLNRKKLKKYPALRDEPIILHGQTGTGKTIALGSLAFNIRKNLKLPVLFIERKIQKPLLSDIDMFSKWAEDFGAQATVIIWDGMLNIEQYYDLLRYLLSRGRKVILIGSTYRLKESYELKKNLIEAPASLSPAEIPEFKNFLKKIDPAIADIIYTDDKYIDDTFLVALFRILPPTRSIIRSGVDKEVGWAEQRLKAKAKDAVKLSAFTTLQLAMLEAGLIEENSLLTSEPYDIGGESVDKTQELIALVMVPGQFGLKVPIELIMRCIGRSGILDLENLFGEIDLLRWDEDNIGNISVGPRTALEAKLVVQSRLGGPRTEVEFFKKLISEIKENGNSFTGHEIEFAVDLIRCLGPNGRNPTYYAPYWDILSETLKYLREQRGLKNARIMLQEAMLLRELVANMSQCGTPPEDAEEILSKAQDILTDAYDMTDQNPQSKKFRAAIIVELASTLGTKAMHILQCTEKPQNAKKIFKEARNRFFQARTLDPESYYPIDVFSWTSRDLLKSNILTNEERIEIEADILHVLSVVDSEDLVANQWERFNIRRIELGNLLGKTEISESAFEELIAKGSSAGHYIKASNISGKLPVDETLDEAGRKRCDDAVVYLKTNMKQIIADSRCLYLLLKLWWLNKTGNPMFFKERQILSFDEHDWSFVSGIILKLIETEEFYSNPRIKYLEGLASFHLGLVDETIQIFKELDRASAYVSGRRRIMRSYLASTTDGKATVYDGTVSWVDLLKNKGGLYVPTIRKNIGFLPTDFGRTDIKKGDNLSFHIAFNFIGPIADSFTNQKIKKSDL